MNAIPVYGLEGLDDEIMFAGLGNALKSVTLADATAHVKPSEHSAAFVRYANGLKDPYRRAAEINRHSDELNGLAGIYNVSFNKIVNGQGNNEDFVNLKKVRILITLDNSDHYAYRLAKIYMPYVVDIDEAGNYYFPSLELANLAARGEEQLIKLQEQGATEETLDGFFKTIGNAFKKAGKVTGNAIKSVVKTTGNTVKAAAKSTVNAVKASYNVTKASVQLVGGNVKGAKESIKKAANQIKDAAIEPIKQAAKDTRDVVKSTVVDPTVAAAQVTRDITKESVQIAGKTFKVLFIKINPVTVLMRNALRALISINFIGMATRFNIGLMTEAQAAQLGYDNAAWSKAKQAVTRIRKLFKSMGGNDSKLLKSISNGAKKKPLFKKDLTEQTKIDFANNSTDDGESSLGDPATISALIALIIKLIPVIWSWIKSIIQKKKAQKAAATAEEQQAAAAAEQERKVQEMYKIYAHDENGNFYTDENGDLITIEDYNKMVEEEAASDEKRKKYVLIGGAALVGIAAFMMFKD